MKIDYICFSAQNLNSNDFIVEENDDENMVWIKSMEQKLIQRAKEKNILLIFNRENKKFYHNNEEIDITNKVIFPRSNIEHEKELLEEIEKNGGLSIETIDNQRTITIWPTIIQPLHRQITVTTFKEFSDNPEKYHELYKNLFFKTALKSHNCFTLKSYRTVLMSLFSENLSDEDLFTQKDSPKKPTLMTNPPIFNVHSDDIVFLTETFERIDDPKNKVNCKEYRIFVIDNTIVSISRSYVDYPTIVPNEVKTFAFTQVEKVSNSKKFPSSYVLDIGQVIIDRKEVIDIIEFNPICSSGLEVNNDLITQMEELSMFNSNHTLKKRKKEV
jgi:hypothetical protein